jgi:hypothetical protein
LQVFQWGNPATDAPFFFFPIDVDGDGKNDPMVQRGVNGKRTFFVRRSSDGQMFYIAWGTASNSFFPLFGDYDGDGKTDFVSRETLAGGNQQYRWHIFQSATQTSRHVDFGQFGDQRPGEQIPEERQVGLPVYSEEILESR